MIDLEKFADYDIVAVPDYALPYLVNSDPSGLSEDDIRNIDEFADDMAAKGFDASAFTFVTEDDEGNLIEDYEQEPSFTWSPAFGDATGCFICLFAKLK